MFDTSAQLSLNEVVVLLSGVFGNDIVYTKLRKIPHVILNNDSSITTDNEINAKAALFDAFERLSPLAIAHIRSSHTAQNMSSITSSVTTAPHNDIENLNTPPLKEQETNWLENASGHPRNESEIQINPKF